MSKIIWFSTFSAWIILLSMRISRPIHVVAIGNIFSYGWVIFFLWLRSCTTASWSSHPSQGASVASMSRPPATVNDLIVVGLCLGRVSWGLPACSPASSVPGAALAFSETQMSLSFPSCLCRGHFVVTAWSQALLPPPLAVKSPWHFTLHFCH